MLSDQELLQLIRNDQIAAFEELYHRYWESMYNAAYKRLRNREQCKDLLQDIFADLWKRKNVVSIDNVSGFLHMAVHYQVYKLVGKQASGPAFLELFDRMAASPYAADSRLEEKEFLQVVKAWVNAMPEKRREIFQLHYLENMNTREIADHLHISQKTVQNQLGKAVHHLRDRLSHLFTIIV
ncbi:RNA polymerase sigma factor [Chitinophaga defluvii]|uniref:Sigma-70 family RNA polymerase sigma factor n=1 Tax=Chitinophaga defluvii TaxID=3163343 RepID=A0ABV2TA23_9BACT